ncbi:MAG: FHA domain-containing protein [Spongiibacteraceae bacterium]
MIQDKTIIRSSGKSLALRGCEGAHLDKTYPIKQVLKVGRERDNDLIIREGFVSRHHATLRYLSGVLTVTDCDSSNGTYVNGEPVRTALLAAGDQLKFDTIEFLVVAYKPEAAEAELPPAVDQQQLNVERHTSEKFAREMVERAGVAHSEAEQQRLAKEQAAREKTERERLAAQQEAKLKVEQERIAAQLAAEEKAAEEVAAAEQATKAAAAKEKAAKEAAEQQRLEKIKLEQQLAAKKQATEKALIEQVAQLQAAEEVERKNPEVPECTDAEQTVFSPAVTPAAVDGDKTVVSAAVVAAPVEDSAKDSEKTVFAQAVSGPVALDEEKTIVAPVALATEKNVAIVADVDSQEKDTAVIGQDAVNKIKLAAAANPTEVELLGITEPVVERKFKLNKSILTVGRSPFNDIILKSASVSSQHAELEKIDGRWWVRDLASSNGTFVNDQPVDECELYSDDSLIFGEVELTFDHHGLMPAPEGREIDYLEAESGSPLLLWCVGAGVVVAIIATVVVLI